MKDSDGEWVVDRKGVEEVWAMAFEILGAEEKKEDDFDEKFAREVRARVQKEVLLNDLEGVLDVEIRLEEIEVAVKNMKRGKAVGIDRYMNEIFMYGGEKITEATWKLCRVVFRRECYPSSWSKGLIFPIFKGTGDKYNPMNYRGITLLSVLGKIFTSVLNQRLTKWIEDRGILVEEQAGFRRVRSVVDQLFILAEIIKNRRPEDVCMFRRHSKSV